ncbi:MAG: FHA domain-containing protein [Anaerolineae bacterium]|nr:FHA domain-containing protein [Anaerolineae bacterium]
MNRADSDFCEACGAPLHTADDTLPTRPAEDIVSPDADASEFPAQVATRTVEAGPERNEPRWGDARIDERTQLLAYVIHHDRSLRLDIHATGTVVVGRQQLDSCPEAKLDLSEFDALEAGISREHARFELKDYSLYITDLDSTNGTYLNGLRILPRQPRVVRDGDEVRLGRLKLQILFVRPMEDSASGVR